MYLPQLLCIQVLIDEIINNTGFTANGLSYGESIAHIQNNTWRVSVDSPSYISLSQDG